MNHAHCLKYKKAPLRPVVGLPFADNFIQVVCMDFEVEHNVTRMFHLIGQLQDTLLPYKYKAASG